jgi:hypothetical protein
MPNYNYNINPAPTTGKGAYGMVPGQIALPPSIYEQMQNVYSGMTGLTSGAGDVISSQLKGQLSPETMSNIQNYAASRGVSLGQPNSDIANLIGLQVTGQTTEGLQSQGLQSYLNFLSGVGSTQTNPQLAYETSLQNAIFAAAPDPAAAAAQQQSLQQQYMNQAFSQEKELAQMQFQQEQALANQYRNLAPSAGTGVYAGAGMGRTNPFADFPIFGGFNYGFTSLGGGYGPLGSLRGIGQTITTGGYYD